MGLIIGTVFAQDTDVTLQLGWVHTAEYSGFYIAEDAGFYADENLSVEIANGGFDADDNFIYPPGQVLDGEADFGITGADQLLSARANGAPLVAIATIFQRNPVVVISFAENDIVRPEDLIGKSISVDTQSSTGLSFVAMLNELDIDIEELDTSLEYSSSYASLVDGEVDALLAYVTNQVVALEAQGYELNMIFPSDYAIDLYTNVIFTTEEMIENEPELVEAFLRASLLGFQGVVDDPEYAAELTIPYNDSLTVEIETASVYQSLPLLNPMGSSPGKMSSEVWEFMGTLLFDAGILEEEIDIESAYTLEFLDAIYAD